MSIDISQEKGRKRKRKDYYKGGEKNKRVPERQEETAWAGLEEGLREDRGFRGFGRPDGWRATAQMSS